MIDKIKLVLALLIVAAGVAGYYLLADQALVLRILAVLAGFVVAVMVVRTTPLGQQGFAFARESAAEARKVVWPTRKETIQTTAIVLILVVIVAAFLALVDYGFLQMVKVLMGRDA